MKESHKILYKKIVETLQEFSSADRAKVACLILKDNRIVSTGYNGQLPGQPHDIIFIDGHDISTIHAEQNAIMNCTRLGISTLGCEAFVSHFPCQVCTKLLISAGIKKVYYVNDYRNDDNPFSKLLELEKVI